MEEAAKHIGETACVHGKVLTVSATPGGTYLLRFCEEGRECGFSAVVFARDLRQVGDVRTLEGKEVDIHGQIRLYHGQPEVIVRDSRQLKGEAAKLPPIPKNYDVSNRGKYSAGQRPSHKDTARKRQHYPRRGAETIPEGAPQAARD
jgi:DNA/RNA endonuclease YhcR with UshA esterase domain